MFEVEEEVDVILRPEGRKLRGIIRQTNGRLLAISFETNEPVKVTPGQSLLVEQSHEQYVFQFLTSILQYRENCFVVSLMPPQQIKRRRTPRLECRLDAWMFPAATAGGFRPATLVKTRVRVGDISLGGARVYVPESLKLGGLYHIEICLAPGETIASDAHIVHCSPICPARASQFPDMNFAAGLQYTEITRAELMQLQRFLQKNTPRA